MKAVGVVRHKFYTPEIELIVLELTPFDIYTCIMYTYAMQAVGVVRHLFYTSKMQLIVLDLKHLIYKYVYCIYPKCRLLEWLDPYSILQKLMLIVLEINHLIYQHV